MTPKDKLVARIYRAGDLDDPATPAPLVSLEEFFEGNDDPGSIGCNLPGEVMPSEFWAALSSIRARDDVADVLVEVAAHEDPDDWPFADTVWVITAAAPEVVRSWMPERLEPDDVFDGLPSDRAIEPRAVPEGLRAVGLWYD
ncbi:MAG: hypothetical protein H6835_15595 [Planctomycetes bacterium]|nr:hypothetical protein [Planctomycetota bacterium]